MGIENGVVVVVDAECDVVAVAGAIPSGQVESGHAVAGFGSRDAEDFAEQAVAPRLAVVFEGQSGILVEAVPVLDVGVVVVAEVAASLQGLDTGLTTAVGLGSALVVVAVGQELDASVAAAAVVVDAFGAFVAVGDIVAADVDGTSELEAEAVVAVRLWRPAGHQWYYEDQLLRTGQCWCYLDVAYWAACVGTLLLACCHTVDSEVAAAAAVVEVPVAVVVVLVAEAETVMMMMRQHWLALSHLLSLPPPLGRKMTDTESLTPSQQRRTEDEG